MRGGSRKTGRKPAAGRRLLGLGAAPVPLALEAEAGDDADDGPAPVVEVEEGRGAADGFVVGVRSDMDEGGRHNEGG